MYCVKCGTELPNNIAFCPNCGTHMQVKIETKPKINVISIIGLAISAFSLLLILIPIYGVVSGSGILLSIIGLIQIIKNKERGYVIAILGIIFGIISTFINVLFSMAVFS